MSSTVVASRREWAGLAVLSLPALLASLELTVTHLALPAIGEDLAATSTQQLWIVDIYAFLLAGSLITVGALGDRVGRRRLLLAGAAAYGAISLLAAYAPSAELLIAARAGLGLAGATLMPSALALIAAMFQHARERTIAISVLVSSVSAGTAIGPLAGGWLLERFWWGSAFLIGVPVMAVLLLAGPLVLPEQRGPRGRLDLVSAMLSMAAVLPAVYGLKRIAVDGFDGPAVLGLVAGTGFALAFAARQRGLEHPLVDLRLFANRSFSVAVATLAGGIFVLWAVNYAVAQYLQLVHGLSPLSAGLWTAPSAAGVIAGSTLAPLLVRRVAASTVIGTGLVLSAVGFAVLTRVDGLGLLLAGTVTVSAGLGPMMALATEQVIRAAPPERAGMASAISSTAPQLGGAFGIAILGSVIAAVYRHRVSGAIPPGTSPEAAAAARDNLAGATAYADQIGTATLDQARAAFTTAVQVTATVSAVLTLLLAVVVLRRRGSDPGTV